MFALLAILASAIGSAYGSVSDCSNGASLFKLTSMSFSPDPTIPGQNSTLLLSMKVPEEITNGTATYSTTYNFIPLKPTTDDLCGTTVPCPIAEGHLNTASSYPIDKALSGSMTLKVEWSDLTGRQLLCVTIKTKLGDAGKQVALRGSGRAKKHRNHKAHLKYKAELAKAKCRSMWLNSTQAEIFCD